MHLYWWQWVLVVVGGLIGLVVVAIVLIVLALLCLIAANNYAERRKAKRTTRFARVVEKLQPGFELGTGPLDCDFSMPWVYPCEGMEPERYELLLCVSYIVQDIFGDDDYDEHYDPPLGTITFMAVVDQQTYEMATVGGIIENPYFEVVRTEVATSHETAYETS